MDEMQAAVAASDQPKGWLALFKADNLLSLFYCCEDQQTVLDCSLKQKKRKKTFAEDCHAHTDTQIGQSQDVYENLGNCTYKLSIELS